MKFKINKKYLETFLCVYIIYFSLYKIYISRGLYIS